MHEVNSHLLENLEIPLALEISNTQPNPLRTRISMSLASKPLRLHEFSGYFGARFGHSKSCHVFFSREKKRRKREKKRRWDRGYPPFPYVGVRVGSSVTSHPPTCFFVYFNTPLRSKNTPKVTCVS